uniref:Histone H2A/H2B/H3 domain-containing protein n=1 Tax=Globodera rostochiensis TaxID=31243 RepID=A0A914HJ18_GLORO
MSAKQAATMDTHNQLLFKRTSAVPAVKKAGVGMGHRAAVQLATKSAPSRRHQRYQPSRQGVRLPPPPQPLRQKRHKKRGSLALAQIRKFQASVNLLLPRAAFFRVAREVTMQYAVGMRWQGQALLALQTMAECYLVNLFEDANMCALHAGRVTIMQKDITLRIVFALEFFLKNTELTSPPL